MTPSTPDHVTNEPDAPKLPCPKCGTKLRMETILGTSRDITDCIPQAIDDIKARIEHWKSQRPDDWWKLPEDGGDPATCYVIAALDFALLEVETIADALKYTTVRFVDAASK